MKWYVVLIFLGVLSLSGCKKDSHRDISDPLNGRVKTVSVVYPPGDTSMRVNFYYDQDGTLDSLSSDAFSTFNSNGNLIKQNGNGLVSYFVNRRLRDPEYEMVDSNYLQYNASSFLEYHSHVYFETDPCMGNLSSDSFEYSGNNINRQIYNYAFNGCTAGSTYWGRKVISYFYDLNKTNSLTNANFGMPYFGNSNLNALDSVYFETCDYQDESDFHCETYGFKVNNTYDTQGRIIQTNMLPPFSIFLCIYPFFEPGYFVTTGAEVFITYY